MTFSYSLNNVCLRRSRYLIFEENFRIITAVIRRGTARVAIIIGTQRLYVALNALASIMIIEERNVERPNIQVAIPNFNRRFEYVH